MQRRADTPPGVLSRGTKPWCRPRPEVSVLEVAQESRPEAPLRQNATSGGRRGFVAVPKRRRLSRKAEEGRMAGSTPARRQHDLKAGQISCTTHQLLCSARNAQDVFLWPRDCNAMAAADDWQTTRQGNGKQRESGSRPSRN